MKSKVTAILVDDESLSMDVITAYLKPYKDITIAGAFSRSSDAVEAIIRLKPDLLFLDINMPVLNGFQLLEALIGKHDPYIIFTTAFDQYAIKAFEVNAIGYLLKPFDRKKFDAVIEKYFSISNARPDAAVYESLVKMLREKPAVPEYLDQFMVKTAQKIIYVPAEEVYYITASGDYVTLVTVSGQHIISTSLAALEAQLSPEQFVRIHRSAIINTKQVKEFIPYFNGEYHVVMRNSDTLKMSRNYKENLARVFKGL